MSFAYRRAMERPVPKRPLGIGILATIGILIGLAQIVGTLFGLWQGWSQSEPFLALTTNFAIGMTLALLNIWIHWGLWDLMSSSWWVGIAFYALGVFACVVALVYLPNVVALLSGTLPRGIAGLVVSVVTGGGILVALVLSLVITVYLVSVHEAFGVATGQERKPWER